MRGLELIMWSQGQREALTKTAPDGANTQTDTHTSGPCFYQKPNFQEDYLFTKNTKNHNFTKNIVLPNTMFSPNPCFYQKPCFCQQPKVVNGFKKNTQPLKNWLSNLNGKHYTANTYMPEGENKLWPKAKALDFGQCSKPYLLAEGI